jgi:hypothetical protein
VVFVCTVAAVFKLVRLFGKEISVPNTDTVWCAWVFQSVGLTSNDTFWRRIGRSQQSLMSAAQGAISVWFSDELKWLSE